MRKFNIGDVVKPTISTNSFEFFIVTDVEEVVTKKNQKSTSGEEVTVTKIEVVYELMRIYPVSAKSKTEQLKEKDIAMVGKSNSSEAIQTLQFVGKERVKLNITSEPDFIRAIKANTFKNSIPETSNDYDSVVDYNSFNTIDDMLDAMNTLQMLYDSFGDEAYLQLKEGVEKNLKKHVHKHSRREKKPANK